MNKKNLGILIIVLGIISGTLFVSAGSSISKTGVSMAELKSQAGNTVAESYYQSVGELAKGLSVFMYAMGMSVVVISMGFGGNLLFRPDDNLTSNTSTTIHSAKINPINTINKFDDLPEL